MFPLNWRFLQLSTFEKIGGAGQTDGQTDGRGATFNAASYWGPHND